MVQVRSLISSWFTGLNCLPNFDVRKVNELLFAMCMCVIEPLHIDLGKDNYYTANQLPCHIDRFCGQTENAL